MPNPYDGPPPEFLFDEVVEISDQDLRDHLASVGLDPATQPAFCVQEVATHWRLPVAVAAQMVDNLR